MITDNKVSSLEFTSVESSTVSAVAYDQINQRIYIEFKRGATYRYDKCSQLEYTEMMDSGSIGQFIHKVLNGKDYTEVERP